MNLSTNDGPKQLGLVGIIQQVSARLIWFALPTFVGNTDWRFIAPCCSKGTRSRIRRARIGIQARYRYRAPPSAAPCPCEHSTYAALPYTFPLTPRRSMSLTHYPPTTSTPSSPNSPVPRNPFTGPRNILSPTKSVTSMIPEIFPRSTHC